MEAAQQDAVAAAAENASVAVGPAGGPAGERIRGALAAAGFRATEATEPDTRAVISAHARADAAACALVRDLGRSSEEMVVIAVVEHAGPGDVRRILQAGARAVVTEASIETALAPSIEAALAGQIAIPARSGARSAPRLLTTREKQILGMVVMGMTNAAIASQLFLAESTVKSHLSSAFSKLGVSSRSEAATVILDPRSGVGLGILTIPTERRS
jgi:DNA-binding NarL/FixJ family response regulator